ncbi:unnamed protein product, partial [marine sediment metagenome]
CWILSPWSKKALTPVSLMGEEFFEGIIEPRFKTEEDWKKHKQDLQNMARFHSRILRELKEKKIVGKVVMKFDGVKKQEIKKHGN